MACALIAIATISSSANPAVAQCAEVDTSTPTRPWDMPEAQQEAAILVTVRDVAWLAQHPAFGDRLTALLAEHGLSADAFGTVRAGVGSDETPSLTLSFEAGSELNIDALTRSLEARGLTRWTSAEYRRHAGDGNDRDGCALTHRFSTNEATRLDDAAPEATAPVSISMRTLHDWAELDPALADIDEIRVHIAESVHVEFEVRDPRVADAMEVELTRALSRLSEVPEVVALGLAGLLSSAQVVTNEGSLTVTFPQDEGVWAPIHELIADVLESEFQ